MMVVGMLVGTCVRFRLRQSYVVDIREHCEVCATVGETRFAKVTTTQNKIRGTTSEAIVVRVSEFFRVCGCIKSIGDQRLGDH